MIKHQIGRHIPWLHLSAAGALHLTANVVSYIGPICCYDIFLTLGLLLAVILSSGKSTIGITIERRTSFIVVYWSVFVVVALTISGELLRAINVRASGRHVPQENA